MASSLLPIGINAQSSDLLETKVNPVSLSINGNLANEKRFWGMPFLDSPLYDQALNVSKGKISASLVGHRDIKNERWFDFDAVVNYSQPVSDNFSVSAGAVGFYFNLGEGWDTAAVLYAGATSSLPLNPTITANKLIKFGGGNYIEGSLSKTFPVNGMDIFSSVALGYNDEVAGRTESGFTHLDAKVSIPIKLTEDVNMTPSVDYIVPLTKEISKGFLGSVNFNYNLK